MRPAGEGASPSRDDDQSDLHVVPPPLDVVSAAPVRPFFGRDRELAILVGELAAAAVGDGRLILVTGDAGIGKTRMVQELAARAHARGFEVLWGIAEDDAPGYWPWVQVIREWMAARGADRPGLDLEAVSGELRTILLPSGSAEPDHDVGSLDPTEARFHLHDGLVRTIRTVAAQRPLLIVLDDLHRADRDSLALLRSFASRLAGARLAIVTTVRGNELASGDRLTATLSAVARAPATRRLTLRGIDEPAISRWVAAAGRVADPAIVAAIARRSAGNPFFVGELVRLLDDGGLEDVDGTPIIPDGVRAVVRRRLTRVSPDCGCLLRLLAVVGAECSRPLAERLAGLPSHSVLALLDEAVRADLLVERRGGPGRWSFTHDLIHEALRGELDGPTRARLHAAVAMELTALHAHEADPPAAVIARHFFLAAAAGHADQAVTWAEHAAAQANRLWAWEDAVRHYEHALHALELAPPVDARKRAELLLAQAKARARAGDSAAARCDVSSAADVAIRLDAPDLLARAALQFRAGQFSLSLGADPDHVRLLEAARAGVGDRDPALRARVLAKLALERLAGGDAAAHATLSAEALDLARATGDPVTFAAAGTSCHWGLLGSADLVERQALARETLRAARAAGDGERIVSALFQLVVDLVEQGDVRAARRLLHDARLGARLPVDIEYWRAILTGFQLLMRGRFEAAESAIDAVAALAGRLRPDHDVAAVVFGLRSVLRREQGRLQEMEPVFGLQIDPNPRRFLTEAGLALFHAQVGRMPEARTAFGRLLADGLDRVAPDAFFLPTVAMLAELSALLDDTNAARAIHARLAPYGTRAVVFGHLAGYWGCSAMYVGLLAGVLGAVEEAERQFAAALAFDEGLGAEPWMTRTRCHWAALLLARDGPGDRARAAALAAAAVDSAGRLGMPVVLERAFALDLAARGRAPGDAQHGAAGMAMFLRDGDVWTLGWGGQVTRVRDTKGLRYLARLVARAGEQVHALELTREVPVAEPIDAVAAERARSTVTQRIRGALRRIAAQHPPLAQHLGVHVRTGTRCVYRPDAARPVRWTV